MFEYHRKKEEVLIGSRKVNLIYKKKEALLIRLTLAMCEKILEPSLL